MNEASEYVIEIKGLTKKFYGVRALDQVDFRLKKGTVHALMGENGAGKSTLMNVLAGIHQPDEGVIIYKGEEVRFPNPQASINSGISMIHQELNVIQDLSVAENIFVGNEFRGRSRLFVDHRKTRRETQQLLQKVGLDVQPTTLMRDLSTAQAQMVEIAKAISKNADVIIMDEPTSSITLKEVDVLFDVIRKLKGEGRSIIYISHKLEEVFEIADEVTVFRDGKYVVTKPISELTTGQIIKYMIDRDLNEMYEEHTYIPKDVCFEVQNLSCSSLKLRDINFKIHTGEILGLAGLVGAGRSETCECIFGLHKLDSGNFSYKGKPIKIRSPKDAIKAGIGFITEDRKLSGLVLSMNVQSNMTLVSFSKFAKLKVFLNTKRERTEAVEFQNSLKLKVPHGLQQIVTELSGGNQQKVVLAKWLMDMPDLLIMDEPTRGIDVGAKAEIYKLIVSLAGAGKTILLVSSEMQEILGLSDRVVVFHEGQVAGELTKNELSQERIMELATGVAH